MEQRARGLSWTMKPDSTPQPLQALMPATTQRHAPTYPRNL